MSQISKFKDNCSNAPHAPLHWQSQLPPFETLDSAYINEICGASESDPRPFLKKILGIFIEKSPLEIAKLEAAQLSDEIRNTTHKLRGMAENIGAFALGEACANLEDLTENEPLDPQIRSILTTSIKTLHTKVIFDLKKIDLL
jgi:HPt (histidine-containing phosphotransfer) domain-containing protein